MPGSNIAIFPLSNSIPLFFETSTLPGWVGQDVYCNTNQLWQSKLPYKWKALFSDVITIEVHTQSNAAYLPVIFPTLFICDKNKNVIGSINLNAAPYYKGCQTTIGYNIYTDPFTGATAGLVTSMWSFKFSDFPIAIPAGGVFYLKMVNQDQGYPSDFTDFFSEPIFLSNTWPNTRLLQSTYTSNNFQKDLIVSGWFNDPGPNTDPFNPVFSVRVEGFVIRTAPKVVNIGYLQQAYQQVQNKTQQIQFWKFKPGELKIGIPWFMLDMVTEAILADTLLIDNYPLILYNPQNSSALADVWKLKGERDESPLVMAECLLMNKFNSQRALVSPFSFPATTLHDEGPFDALHN